MLIIPEKTEIVEKELYKPAGLYIHIPYCKRKCSYCNFHFSTNLRTKNLLFNALIFEIETRSAEGDSFIIQSIYFGGGTPSLLNESELNKLLNTIRTNYKLTKNPEITLEANPDDLNPGYLDQLLQLGINRLSIGVQSFHEPDLRWMNRAHNVKQSHDAIEFTIQAGFSNFSIDLMYGLPGQNYQSWLKNLEYVLGYQAPHFSAYALTLEEKTDLYKKVQLNTIQLPEEFSNLTQMDCLLDFCDAHSYEAYEISNFSKKSFRAKHNSAYWEGVPYFGFGPAAHSYLGDIRRWNIANNNLYIQAIENNLIYFETEVLSKKNHCNEYLMLQLRRIEGLDLVYIEHHFGEFFSYIKSQVLKQIEIGNMTIINEKYCLTRKGKYIADQISVNLFVGL
ncbi:MAG: radical SAM family heme chaperone HemW [Saprospiraceae bacterium]|nr:radical SAM family heme chaperone HemW [Saprospiraceae bacterium]